MEFSVTLPRTAEFTVEASASLLNFSMVGLTGHSGAGKTSLFRALAGLEKNAQVHSRFKNGALNRARVGLVFQEPLLLPHLTVEGNLQLATRYKASHRTISQDDDAIIAGCHCQHLLQRSPNGLSGGEAQRVALARALLNQPELLLLDEPLSAVDQSTRTSIMQWLRQVADQGLPMMLISHDISDLWLHCQSLLLMQNGRIVCHDVPAEVERDHLYKAIEIIKRLTGERPLGWYTGRCSPNTRDLVMEEGGFLYDSDSYSDDLPYWEKRGKKKQLIIPYTLDNNDMRFATNQGFNSGDQFYTYLKDSFDALYNEGKTSPKMMSVGLHCRLIGRPGRIQSLRKFLDYILKHDDIWICKRIDIAKHWINNYPLK